MMNIVKRVDRDLFKQIVQVIRTGKIAMDDSSVDLSPDQTIRINNGKVTFSPPLKVQKTVDVLSGRLGALNVQSTIREMVVNTPGDTIHIDLIASPIDIDIKPESGSPRPQFLTMPETVGRVSFQAGDEVSQQDWERLEADCQTAFKCSTAQMAVASRRNYKHMAARRRDVDRIVSATRTAKTRNPTATGVALLLLVLGIMFPLAPSFMYRLLLSGLQRLILDWIFDETGDSQNQVNLSGASGGKQTLP